MGVRGVVDGPFEDITSVLDTLAEGETLVPIISFEPEPLYAVLERRRFTYEATRIDDEWRMSIAPA